VRIPAASAAFALVALALALALAPACKDQPRAGAPCTSGMVCDGAHAALVCGGGTYSPLACRGPRGCTGQGSSAYCDMQLAEEGDACLGGAETYACAVDHQRALSCHGGKWTLWRSCKGEGGCAWKGRSNVECDSTIADIGDPCTTAGNVACSPDGKNIYVCRGDKFDTYKGCRGDKGCRVTDRVAECDTSLAAEGDACDVAEDRVCTVDKKSVLVCRGGKLLKEKDCRRDGGCLFIAHGVTPKCDFP
jgi:hypothetical protein